MAHTPFLHPFRALRIVAVTALVVVAGARMPGPQVLAQGACGANPIVCENLNPGTPSTLWDVSGAGDPSIQGFPTEISVNRGGTVHFKIKTDAPSYQIAIYRIGYYGGSGARAITTIGPSATLPQSQPVCVTDSTTGLVDCGNWTESASWTVPATATSGIYFAKLTRPDTGGASHILFVIRDDSGQSDLLFQTSDTTWQAYNQYGGKSLYTGGPGTNPSRAYKVSYNRPITTRGTTPTNAVFNAEYPMVRWLEANGYNVSYISGADTDRNGAAILNPQNHKVFMSVGHDEYWSGAQRTRVEAARAAGLHLAFFSGNEIFWKARWEASIDGSSTPYRTLVSYKETHANAVIDPADPPTWTGTWRDPRFSPPGDGGRPENALSGTIFDVECCQSQFPTLAVPSDAAGLRFWRNTPIAASGGGALTPLVAGSGVAAGGILGYEWDEDLDNGFRPAGLMRLSSTAATVDQKLQDYGSTYGSGTATHALALYRHSSGAIVFSAGTVQWSWGLDNRHDRLPESTSDYTNLSAQQATVNLFADMNAQPGTLQAGLSLASASTDTAPPTSTITSPLNGALVASGTTVTISGTAFDANGKVSGVEVSVDGGLTWRRATGRDAWTFSWQVTGIGTTAVKSRATDDSGNIETPGAGITVTLFTLSCPCSIWNPAITAPAIVDAGDPNPIELGVKFRTDTAGFITGIRFYKSAANTGTHVGHVYSSSGTLLTSATFTGETASGWQQVTFGAPVAITANSTYVASYQTDAGHYSASGAYFASAGVDTPPLHALSNVASSNGVYRYGSGGFPSSSYNATNYWVDVIFSAVAGDPTPPVVTAISPTVNATSVGITTSVTATFSQAIDAATVNTNTFDLRNAGGGLVQAAVSYDSSTRTATLVPAAALDPGATYTARAHGGTTDPRIKDIAGNPLAADFVWSFTTTTPASCPCTIWSPSAVPALADAGDASAVELGVKFRADSDGVITGLRFYKSGANTGTHVGNLWSSAGSLLATATFGGESASGWQTVSFAAPVAVTANTIYVASYHTNIGHYSASAAYFASAGVDTPPLHALANGTSADGVYQYGASGFPSSSYNATNYWVDVVFNTSGGTDTTPPTVVSTSPAAGAAGVGAATTVTATFSESVDATTVSTSTFELRDSGNVLVGASVTYDAPSRTATLTPSAPLGTGTVYTARVHGGATDPRIKDLAGNALSADVVWSFTTATPGACPCSIWNPATAVPSIIDTGDASSLEMGVKFRADSGGVITGLRFYKSSANTGTHVGNLWTSTGTLLASATFSGESGSGWQTVSFSPPVAVTANTTYVASYHTDTGHYSAGGAYFASVGVDSPPLHALANATSANGVYNYGASAFPTSSYNATNYWVDVVFSSAADTTPPTVTTVSPTAGVTGVSANTTVTATFSESVDPTTVTTSTFELRNAGNALVAAGVTYDAPTRTATLAPTAALTYGATYSARVHGGATDPRVKDLAGNALAADMTWSFTVLPAPTTFVDTTAADFARGSLDVGAYIGQTGDGEVMLAPVTGAEFSGATLPAGWSLASWGGAVTGTVSAGMLSVDGGRLSTDALFGPGRSLEFSAIFSGATYQHVGFGLTFTETPWAIFSSRGGDALYARTNNGSQTIETPIAGSWFGAAHRFRIDWTTSGLTYSIDGVQVASHALSIATTMRPIVSDYASDSNPVKVDWLRLTPYASLQEGPGLSTFTSGVFDASATVTWTTATWTGATPAGTAVGLSVRYGSTPTPDASWTLFTPVSGPINGVGRYLQYRLQLSTTDLNQTPVVNDVTLNLSR